MVVLTRGSRPGLFLLNAASFLKPSGPPMMRTAGDSQVSHGIQSKPAPGVKVVTRQGEYSGVR